MRLHRPPLGLLGTLAGILAALILSPAARAQTATESDGPQADAGHTGYVYGAGVVPPLTQAWFINTGPFAVPTVSIDQGHVFVIESDANYNDTLVSIDLASGKPSWSQPVGAITDGADAGVVVDAGRVFVSAVMAYDGTDHSEDGGYVVSAWDEQSGAPLWSDTLEQHDSGVFTPAVVAGGVIYAQDGLDAYALDERNGGQIWSTVLNANSNKLLDSADNSLTIAGGVAFIGASGCNTEEGLSTTTGAILWSENTNACTGGGSELAAVGGGEVWTPGLPQGNLPAAVYDPTSGAILGGFPTATPAFGYGEAVGIATQPDGYSGSPVLEAFDPASRNALWSLKLQTGDPADVSGAAGLPLLADGLVYETTSPAYPTNTGPQQVLALSPCTGVQVWQAALPFATNEAAAELAAGDGYLLVSSAEGELAAFKGSGVPQGAPPACLGANAGGTTGAGSGPGAGVSPDSAGSSLPTRAQVLAALRHALAREARGAAHVARREYRCTVAFHAPSAGRLSISWVTRIGHRRLLIAHAGARPRARRTLIVTIRLNRRGRRLLEARGRLRPRTTWTFTPAGERATSASRTLDLRR